MSAEQNFDMAMLDGDDNNVELLDISDPGDGTYGVEVVFAKVMDGGRLSIGMKILDDKSHKGKLLNSTHWLMKGPNTKEEQHARNWSNFRKAMVASGLADVKPGQKLSDYISKCCEELRGLKLSVKRKTNITSTGKEFVNINIIGPYSSNDGYDEAPF